MNNKIFFDKILKLNYHHYKNSINYQKIIKLFFKNKNINNINQLPFIPARLFKEVELKSISKKKIFKVLNSSGTSSNNRSRIFLDKKNAQQQTKVLNEIVSEIIGKQRLPMLIIDEQHSVKNKNLYDAKTAAIIGFSLFGKNHKFLIKNNLIDYEGLNNFLNKYANDSFLVFGFTSYVYNFLFKKLNKKKLKNNFSKAILIHGGGWKKMSKININNIEFKKNLIKKLNIKKIYNYYGLIEQTGSIFFECKMCGCFNPSEYSDIIIRDKNFNVLKKNQIGFVQLLSLLPTSYPGHSILTEDLGEIVDNDCLACKGKKKFLIYGRAELSDARGCSDI